MSANKKSGIYVKLRLEKDRNSGCLMIKAHFDPNAPNYSKDENGFKWYPTSEEIDFINEAFELIPKYKSQDQCFTNKVEQLEQLEQSDDSSHIAQEEEKTEEQLKSSDVSTPPPMTQHSEKTLETPDISSSEVSETKEEEVKQEKPSSVETAGKAEEEIVHPMEKTGTYDSEPLEPEKTSFDPPQHFESETEDYSATPSENKKEERILVEADKETIDEIIKRKREEMEDDGFLVEADEKTIIDKVLQQKKKGKWQRKQ
ncbi:MAG: hypothetical protein DRN05_01035 [Thermoplasmata archaeon]|nr:MAG: hypothetical protein DRN05_01035 [Thermoplasmata archaeon]